MTNKEIAEVIVKLPECIEHFEVQSSIEFQSNNGIFLIKSSWISCPKVLEIPEGVLGIDKDCFKFCNNLEKVILPKSLKYIFNRAFSYCENLKEVVVKENNLETVFYDVFVGCNNLKNNPLKITYPKERFLW